MTTLAAAELVAEPAGLVAQAWWHEVLGVIGACRDVGPERECRTTTWSVRRTGC